MTDILQVLIFIFSVFYILQIHAMSPLKNGDKPESYVELAQTIRADVGTLLSKRHNMYLCGTEGGLADCVNILGLRFKIKGALSQEKLRIILIDCVEEFLKTINSNEEIRPNLKNYPFTAREITIGIFVVDDRGNEIYDPEISTAAAFGGVLEYFTREKHNPLRYKTEIEEKYEDALKIVQGLNSP